MKLHQVKHINYGAYRISYSKTNWRADGPINKPYILIVIRNVRASQPLKIIEAKNEVEAIMKSCLLIDHS